KTADREIDDLTAQIGGKHLRRHLQLFAQIIIGIDNRRVIVLDAILQEIGTAESIERRLAGIIEIGIARFDSIGLFERADLIVAIAGIFWISSKLIEREIDNRRRDHFI